MDSGGGGGGLGEVSVDVYADLSRLEQDFTKARAATKQFSNDMANNVGQPAQLSAKEVQQLDRALIGLARSYSPVHTAAIKYHQDLETIRKAQQANILSTEDAAFFQKRANEAWEQAKKPLSGVAMWAQKARQQLALLGIITAGVVAAGFIVAARAALQNAKAVKDSAAEIGLSTDAYQKWMFIASRSGVEASQLEQGFEGLGRAMGKAAAGSKRESDLFALLGISLVDATGKAKGLEAVMPEVADALLRVRDANQRTALATILFGESANEILPALANGSRGINELSEAAKRLGIVLSEEEIRNLDETNQRLEDMKAVLSANIAGVVAENANSIIGLAEAIGSLTGAVLEFLSSNPTLALGIMGGLAGARFGAHGAIIGAGAGMVGGAAMGQANADNNMDPAFRKRALDAAVADMRRLREAQDEPGTLFRVHRTNATGGTLQGAVAEVNRQADLARQSAALRGGPSAPWYGTGTNIDASEFLKRQPRTRQGGAGGRGAADRAERDRIRALREQVAFENEISQLSAEILRTGRGRAANADERARIDLALLDIERQRFEATLELEGPAGTGKYDEVQQELLRTAFMEADAAKRRLVENERLDQNLEDQLAIESTRLGNKADILALEGRMARSTRERRETDLALLELEYELEDLKIRQILASSDLTDTEEAIALERQQFLKDLRDVQREILEYETRGPVADFFDTVQMSADELDDALQRIRAANLEEQRQRAVGFADDISSAFGDMGRAILQLEDPLTILTNLLTDLAATFTEEVLIRPFEQLVRDNVGGPLAERALGAPAGAEGLWMGTLERSGINASMRLDELALAAMRASQGFSAQVLPGFNSLGGASAAAAANLGAAAQGADKFAGASTTAIQALMSLASGGGGGGTSQILSMGLSILGAAAGSFAGGVSPATIARLVPSVTANIAANPGIFHEGGEVGPDGRPVRRPLRPGERNITTEVGETVIPKGPSRMFAEELSMIRAGRMPQLRLAGGGGGMRVDARSFPVSLGGINVYGALDERSGRRTAKQIGAEVNRSIARAASHGIRRHD